jgi:hypothetical protein
VFDTIDDLFSMLCEAWFFFARLWLLMRLRRAWCRLGRCDDRFRHWWDGNRASVPASGRTWDLGLGEEANGDPGPLRVEDAIITVAMI